MFFGMNGFIIRFAYSMQGLILGNVLAVTGYSADLVEQPASAVAGIRFLMAGVPMIALLIAFLAARAYPLHGKRLAQIKAEVERLHREKAQRLV